MPRNRKDPKAMGDACNRFVWLMENVLRISSAEMARELGYANSTTVQKVKRQETFPDVERLQRLASLFTQDGSRPNLHWLITGEGEPVLPTIDSFPKTYKRRRKVG